MIPAAPTSVKEIFAAAAELEGRPRLEYLDQVCPDSKVRTEVERLLRGHDAKGGLLDDVDDDSPRGLRALPLPRPLLQAGEVLDRFRILRHVGSGGMGEVYEAEDLEFGGRVALKTLRGELASDPAFFLRFKREVRLAQQVAHPNVCRIHDFRRCRRRTAEEDCIFLTMEFIEGETLAERLRASGPFSIEEALPIIRQLAEGLQALHAHDIVHRDFKPGNIMLTRSSVGLRAVITDLGLARAARRDSQTESALTVPGEAIGTPGYTAPEQWQGASPTPAADVYAYGVVVGEMLTGRRDALLDSNCSLETPSSQGPQPTAAVAAVLRRSMATNPNDRYRTIEEAKEALAAALSGAVEPSGRAVLPRRWRWAAVFFLAVILSAAALRVIGSGEGDPTVDHAAEAAETLYTAAEARHKSGETHLALRSLEKALEFEPDFTKALMRMGDLLTYTGRSGQAFAYWRRALESVGGAELPLRERFSLRARYAMDSGDWLGAEDACREWTEAYPEDDLGFFYMARPLMMTGHVEEALSVLAAAHQRRPDAGYTLQHLAKYNLIVHRFDEAYKWIQELERLDEAGREAARAYSAFAQFLEGNPAGALEKVQRLTTSSDRHWQAQSFSIEARLHAEAGRIPEALESLWRGIEDDFRKNRSALMLARLLDEAHLHLTAGDSAQAGAAVRRAMDLDPGPRDRMRAGAILARSGHLEEAGAQHDLLGSPQENPEPVFALARARVRGEILLAEGRAADAIVEFRSAVSIEPSPDQREALTRAYAGTGRVDQARDQSEALLREVGRVWHEPTFEAPGFLRNLRLQVSSLSRAGTPLDPPPDQLENPSDRRNSLVAADAHRSL